MQSKYLHLSRGRRWGSENDISSARRSLWCWNKWPSVMSNSPSACPRICSAFGYDIDPLCFDDALCLKALEISWHERPLHFPHDNFLTICDIAYKGVSEQGIKYEYSDQWHSFALCVIFQVSPDSEKMHKKSYKEYCHKFCTALIMHARHVSSAACPQPGFNLWEANKTIGRGHYNYLKKYVRKQAFCRQLAECR